MVYISTASSSHLTPLILCLQYIGYSFAYQTDDRHVKYRFNVMNSIIERVCLSLVSEHCFCIAFKPKCETAFI